MDDYYYTYSKWRINILKYISKFLQICFCMSCRKPIKKPSYLVVKCYHDDPILQSCIIYIEI